MSETQQTVFEALLETVADTAVSRWEAVGSLTFDDLAVAKGRKVARQRARKPWLDRWKASTTSTMAPPRHAGRSGATVPATDQDLTPDEAIDYWLALHGLARSDVETLAEGVKSFREAAKSFRRTRLRPGDGAQQRRRETEDDNLEAAPRVWFLQG